MKRFVLVTFTMAALAVPSSAAAGFGSTITIHWTNAGGGSAFYGVVKSAKSGCFRHRAVNLQQSGDRDSGYSTVATGNETNRDGTWAYSPDPLTAGWFRAVALPKHLSGGTCRRAISRPVGVF